jgi:mono/diheme cytochrome c family protein
MRHLLANIFIYTLAGLLLLGSAVFAWIRSEQLMVTREQVDAERFVVTPRPARELLALGEAVYEANCRHCHGAEGRGWDQYPPVTDMHALVAAPGGREYYVALHLFGLTSPRWRAPMPPMGHIPDVELAAVLDYVLARYGEPVSPGFSADEIAAARDRPLSARAIGRLRPASD